MSMNICIYLCIYIYIYIYNCGNIISRIYSENLRKLCMNKSRKLLVIN